MTAAALSPPEELSAVADAGTRATWRYWLRLPGAWMSWGFGLVTLLVGLSILAQVPVGQFLALGYLLEASGRVARSGRLRDGFIGVRTAARLGVIVAGCLLCGLPLYLMSIFAENAAIIDPGGSAAGQLTVAVSVLTVLYALHVTGACLRGGRLWHFLWPFNGLWFARRIMRGGAYAEARDRLWQFVIGLRLPYYFWLGLRGFIGAFLWLAVPVFLLSLAHERPALGVLGGVLLAGVVQWVPFMQVRFARDGRMQTFREWSSVRAQIARAPGACALALVVHLLFAVPLYLLKIETIPRDVMFVEGLVFLAFMFPARLLGGWAMARAGRRTYPCHPLWRWAAWFVVVPVVTAYVLVVFASQHVGWQGIAGLYEQHAFLLPVPFATWPE